MSKRVIPQKSTLSTLGIVSFWKCPPTHTIFDSSLNLLKFLSLSHRLRPIRFGIQIGACPPILEYWSFFKDLRALHLVEFLQFWDQFKAGFPPPQVSLCLAVCLASAVVSAAALIAKHLTFGAGRGVNIFGYQILSPCLVTTFSIQSADTKS